MKPLPRVSSQALVRGDDDRERFQGAPYSGLAYRVNDAGVVESIDILVDGRPTQTSDDWLDSPKGGPRVLVERLDADGDYGPYFWKNHLLEGVVYTFGPAGHCLSEEVFRRGLPSADSRRAWFPSGARRQLVEGATGNSWFEDGRLESRSVGDTTQLNLTVDDDGRLRGILVADADLFDLDATARFPLAAELSLMGPTIDSAWLTRFRDRTALADVRRLHLVESGVGPEAVDFFAALEGPRELWLQNNRAFRAGDADRLRARRPDCVVHFEAAATQDT